MSGGPQRASQTSEVIRAVATVALALVALLIGWGFEYWSVALGVFIAAVIVAPNHWIKGFASERGDAGPSV
jgi:uncharacterized membrane protein YccC